MNIIIDYLRVLKNSNVFLSKSVFESENVFRVNNCITILLHVYKRLTIPETKNAYMHP